ncbi:MAG TPA: RluA family pseudouridine synthase [bacterium]|nr:RluA family pseudouridine synthase [bacterium]
MRHFIKTPTTLLAFLKTVYPDSSNNTLKQILENDRAYVNGTVCRIGKRPLNEGDVVEIGKKVLRPLHPSLKLVHEDKDLIVIEKPEGLLTIGTDKEKERTVYAYLYDYVKGKDPHGRIFIVHRLDEGTSGLLMVARNKEAQEIMKRQFAAREVERRYIAVAEGIFKQKKGTIAGYLYEDPRLKVHMSNDPGKGEKAVTRYSILKEINGRSIVDVELETGKRAQIRVQLAFIGHPIVGDIKYGAETDPHERIMLHAYRLSFNHPTSGEKLTFESKPPSEFFSK